jgi:hypothetical protein
MTDGLREERKEKTELILLARAGHGIRIHRFEITTENLTDVLRIQNHTILTIPVTD